MSVCIAIMVLIHQTLITGCGNVWEITHKSLFISLSSEQVPLGGLLRVQLMVNGQRLVLTLQKLNHLQAVFGSSTTKMMTFTIP